MTDIIISPKYATADRMRQFGLDAFVPRLRRGREDEAFTSLVKWKKTADDCAPPYQPASAKRDTWLQWFRYQESHIAAVINQACLIYANRGWEMIGGKQQVRKFSDRLHSSARGKGWRYLIKTGALSYLTADINCLFEVVREDDFTLDDTGTIVKAPFLSLNNLDPTKCQLVNKVVKPEKTGLPVPLESTLKYKTQYWFDWDYIRVASMPSDNEAFHGLGFCALSRCIVLVQLLKAVYDHDLESLDPEMMDGLLLLHNITSTQWTTVMNRRREQLTEKERTRYGGVEILAASGRNPDAKLIALSQLPESFDRKTFIDYSMYGIAEACGFDPSEFWVVNAGVLGRGEETRIQSEKATTKGGEDFTLTLQEPLQKELPATIHFEFETRDDSGELIATEILVKKAQFIKELGELREKTTPTFTNDELRQLSAMHDLIPAEWTEAEEEVKATDEATARMIKRRMLDDPRVRNACEQFYNTPIIRYVWRGAFEHPTEYILWDRGDEALRPINWQINNASFSGLQETIQQS